MFGSRTHDLKTVEDAIRAGRVMLMAAGSLPIEQLEQLLRCAATAGVPAFEILRRGVSQNDLAEKLRRLRRIREEDTTLAERCETGKPQAPTRVFAASRRRHQQRATRWMGSRAPESGGATEGL